MSKQAKKLIALVVILVLLVIGYFVIVKVKENKANSEDESTDITVLDISADDVVSFSYEYKGEIYRFEKEDDTWYDADDHTKSLTQYMIENMISYAAPLMAEDKVEDVTDFANYGLDEPEITVNLQTADASYTFYGSEYFNIAEGRFIYLESENTVYKVDSSVVSLFEKTWDDLIEADDTEEESTTVSESDLTVSEDAYTVSSDDVATAETENSETTTEE